MSKNNCKNCNWGIYFVLPAIIGTFIFIIIPIFCSFALSFTEWDLLNDINFVGFSNYKAVLTEPVFKEILLNTLVYALSVTIFAVIIPLIIADVLNSKLRGAEWFKTIYFYIIILKFLIISDFIQLIMFFNMFYVDFI